jgi:excisionase family DNA binding protein
MTNERFGELGERHDTSGVGAVPLKLVGSDGREVMLPPSMLRLMHTLARLLASGQAVALVPAHKQLTTQQAADILNVSRPYLVQLLDRGEIPYTRKTKHRRIRFDDLMAYKRQRDAERFQGLRELTQMSEALGFYDEPVT